jgi:fumagillin biosynthesis monooxygenase
MLFTSVISTVFQVMSPSVNPFKEGVISGRATAQIPSPNGTCGPTPSNTPVVVFNIGLQVNHPLGLLAPHVKTIATFFNTMIADITSRSDELGLLSVSEWRGNDAAGSNNTLKVTLYFGDPAKVNAYAQERLHREAWWFFEKVAGEGHVGVYHEMFCVPARGWETVYVNCRPVLLGAAADEKVEAQRHSKSDSSTTHGFVRPVLVGCDTPVLRTQYARMGRTEDGLLKGGVEGTDQI